MVGGKTEEVVPGDVSDQTFQRFTCFLDVRSKWVGEPDYMEQAKEWKRKSVPTVVDPLPLLGF